MEMGRLCERDFLMASLRAGQATCLGGYELWAAHRDGVALVGDKAAGSVRSAGPPFTS